MLQQFVTDFIDQSTNEKGYLQNSIGFDRSELKSGAAIQVKLTVCKSLRNKISVTNPAPIPIGAKLVLAEINQWCRLHANNN